MTIATARRLRCLPILARAVLPTLPLATGLVPVAAMAQATDPAIDPVRALDDGLLAIARDARALGFKGRAARIAPVVDQVFDLALVTRLSVGPAWTGIAAADRTALVAAFRRMTIAQYAANFDGGAGLAFAIDPKVEARGGDRLVRTTLTQAKGDAVSLAYRLRQTGGRWRVIDIFYQNAISQLATRRSDFARILASGGARALIADLDRQSDKAAR